MTLCECNNCGLECKAEALLSVDPTRCDVDLDTLERIEPAGMCPNCGFAAYEVD